MTFLVSPELPSRPFWPLPFPLGNALEVEVDDVATHSGSFAQRPFSPQAAHTLFFLRSSNERLGCPEYFRPWVMLASFRAVTVSQHCGQLRELISIIWFLRFFTIVLI